MIRKQKTDWEHNEQKALFAWAHLAKATQPELQWLFAVPNGGQRHPAVAAKLKAEGVKRGVPDIGLPVARGGFHGLWIELKFQGNQTAKRGTVSKEQQQWIENLALNGYAVAVCYGWREAQLTIERYLKGGAA